MKKTYSEDELKEIRELVIAYYQREFEQSYEEAASEYDSREDENIIPLASSDYFDEKVNVQVNFNISESKLNTYIQNKLVESSYYDLDMLRSGLSWDSLLIDWPDYIEEHYDDFGLTLEEVS